jgi:hypothetical protein
MNNTSSKDLCLVVFMMLSTSELLNSADKLRRPQLPRGGVVHGAPLQEALVLETKNTKRPFNLRVNDVAMDSTICRHR